MKIRVTDTYREELFDDTILYGTPFLLCKILHFAYGCNFELDSNKYNAMQFSNSGVLLPTFVDFGTPIELVRIETIDLKRIEKSQQEDLA